MCVPVIGLAVVLVATLAGCGAWTSPAAPQAPHLVPPNCPHRSHLAVVVNACMGLR